MENSVEVKKLKMPTKHKKVDLICIILKSYNMLYEKMQFIYTK